MSKTPTQNDWEEKMRSELLEKLDFLSDHWIKGDDRPPFNFGGWREEVADDFIKIYRSYLADARREVIDDIFKMRITDLPNGIRFVTKDAPDGDLVDGTTWNAILESIMMALRKETK